MMFSVAVLLMFAITIEKTDGVCCHGNIHGKCNDCSWGTPYCSYRPCNLFGCACQGECREGSCGSRGWWGRKRRSTDDKDAVHVFHSYDLNKNGKIEKVEFTVAFNQTGLTEEELFVQWREMDDNKDGVITIDEMDHDEF